VALALVLIGVVLGAFARAWIERASAQLDFPVAIGPVVQVAVIVVFGLCAAAQAGVAVAPLAAIALVLLGSIAVTLTLLGRVEEAVAQYRKLLEADAGDLDAMNAVAWIRATHSDPAHRNAEEAVLLAESARDRSPEENAVLFDTLAAAYAEAGRYEDAVAACERAVEIARRNGEVQNVERFTEQLRLFRDSKPFRIR